MSDLRSRDFLLLLTATFGSFSNYAPLLSVVPLWSAEGGSGHGAVGSTTGVVMGTTVLIQLAMPRLLRACGARHLLMAGALLLGLPTFLYPLSAGLPWVLAVSAARGFGFGIVAVAGSALVAELVGPAERGRAVGMYGIAVGLPQVVLLPLGVWAADSVGFGPVFAVTGALSVLSVAAVRPIRGGRRTGRATPAEPAAPAAPAGPPREAAGPVRPLLTPWAALTVAACALGGVTAFLPLVLTAPGVAALALFVLSTSAVLGRWLAGVHGDRHGTGLLLLPSALACAAGMAGLALTGTAPAAVTAAGVYGLGFGALQNDTLVMMFARSTPDQASTVWNIAFDGGTGLGAVAIGLLSAGIGLTGPTGAFAASAALIVLVAPIAYADARRERRARTRTRAGAADVTGGGAAGVTGAGMPSGSRSANGAKDAPAGR